MLFDLSNYQVGDEFETSPHELSQIISAILAEEGSFDYIGESVIIKSLPKRVALAPHVAVPEAAPETSLPVTVENTDTLPIEIWEDEGGKNEPQKPVTEKPVEKVAEKPAVEVTVNPKSPGRPRKKFES